MEIGLMTKAFYSYLCYLPTQEKLDLVHCLFGRHFIRERHPLRKNPVSHIILTLDPIVKFVTFPTSLAFSGTSGGGHVFAAEKLKKKEKNENEKEEKGKRKAWTWRSSWLRSRPLGLLNTMLLEKTRKSRARIPRIWDESMGRLSNDNGYGNDKATKKSYDWLNEEK